MILDDVFEGAIRVVECAAAGDADFWAALQAVRALKETAPNMPVIMGGSSEFVLGMHGEVEFNGRRLAGMYPHEQAKMAEAAGASITAWPSAPARINPWHGISRGPQRS